MLGTSSYNSMLNPTLQSIKEGMPAVNKQDSGMKTDERGCGGATSAFHGVGSGLEWDARQLGDGLTHRPQSSEYFLLAA